VDLVTVVIPYYNKTCTIDRAVNSVIAQKYPNWELFVIDDASKEPLVSRPSWLQYNIHVVRNELNAGPGPTRQKGVERSSGKYLAFLDADDWWDPEFLEVCIGTLDSTLDAAAAWCQTMVYHKDGTSSVRRYSQLPFDRIRSTLLQYARPWQTGSLLWRKQYCTAWGNLRTHQDYLFEFSNSSLSDKVVHVPRILYFVDMTGNDHRTDTVAHKQIVLDHFHLHQYVFDVLGVKLTFREKILLFHRLLRCLWKITEHHTPDLSNEYWKVMERYYPLIVLYSRKQVLLKYTHYLLQKTQFRLYL
jgi:glycosyltransferase involved in cell wall biosynthesis